MLKHSYKIGVIGLLLVSLGFLINLNFNKTKIAYVRIDELVNKYSGMLEARELYKTRVADLEANLDSLHLSYQTAVSQYNSKFESFTDTQKQLEETKLHQYENNIRQYTQVVESKKKEEDTKLTSGVLNQIESFVDEYGDQNGYEMIIGSHAGTVMHGSNSLDITEEVLKALNDQYKG